MTVALILARLRSIPPKVWLILAALALLLALGAYCSHRGAQGEKDRQEARSSQIREKAAQGREIGAEERAKETTTIKERLDERNRDAEATPDSPPDDRELRRRCRQLHDYGYRNIPACSRFDGT